MNKKQVFEVYHLITSRHLTFKKDQLVNTGYYKNSVNNTSGYYYTNEKVDSIVNSNLNLTLKRLVSLYMRQNKNVNNWQVSNQIKVMLSTVKGIPFESIPCRSYKPSEKHIEILYNAYNKCLKRSKSDLEKRNIEQLNIYSNIFDKVLESEVKKNILNTIVRSR